MRFRALSFAFAAALIFMAGQASAARISVTISGLHSAQGNVFVGLAGFFTTELKLPPFREINKIGHVIEHDHAPERGWQGCDQ